MLVPWKKSYDQPRQHIKKQRHYFLLFTLLMPTNSSSQSYDFSYSHVWMWELDYKECWVLKNWWFWTVVLERTLESPLTTRRSNKSILKKISPGYSLEGLMLKLSLQYFGHLMQRTDSFEKTVILGKIEGRRRGQQRMRWLVSSPTRCKWVWASSGNWWWTGKPGMLQSIGSQRVWHDWVTKMN